MINSGVLAKITHEQIVSSVKQQLRIENTDWDIYFLKLVNEGIGLLDTLSNYTHREECLEICDKSVELPCGYQNLIAFRYGNEAGQCVKGIYAELPYINYCGCGTYNWATTAQNWRAAAVIDGDCLVFHQDPLADYVYMAFEGLNVDENGLMVCYQRYEPCIVAYVLWQYYSSIENFAAADRQEKRYKDQKRFIKANDQQLRFRKTKAQIAEWINAWVGQRIFSM
jgi:hypothetical protein